MAGACSFGVATGDLFAGAGGDRKLDDEEDLGTMEGGGEAWCVRGTYFAPVLLLLTSLQLVLCKHSKLKQLVDSVKLFIINDVLNFMPQPPIKMANFILSFLNHATTHHTLL
jgi:hypothetical protein